MGGMSGVLTFVAGGVLSGPVRGRSQRHGRARIVTMEEETTMKIDKELQRQVMDELAWE
jgi:hypothetical protein